MTAEASEHDKPGGTDVTVLIPVLNGGALIGTAIASVLTQTIDSWKLIVVDNKSTDDTVPRVLEFTGDPRIQLICSHERLNALANFRRALTQANTEFCCFLAHDDYWNETFLADQLAAIVRADADAACPTVVNHSVGVPSRGERRHLQFTSGQRPPSIAARRFFQPMCPEVNAWYGVYRMSALSEAWARLGDQLDPTISASDRAIVGYLASRYRFVESPNAILFKTTAEPSTQRHEHTRRAPARARLMQLVSNLATSWRGNRQVFKAIAAVPHYSTPARRLALWLLELEGNARFVVVHISVLGRHLRIARRPGDV